MSDALWKIIEKKKLEMSERGCAYNFYSDGSQKVGSAEDRQHVAREFRNVNTSVRVITYYESSCLFN